MKNPLIELIKQRTVAIDDVKAVLNSAIDVNEKDEKGNTALYYAITNGHDDIVQLLIDPEIAFISHNDDNKVMYKNILMAINTKRADVNLACERGKTPLMIACTKSSTIEAEKLIKLGAKVNAQDDNGETALMYAIRYNKQDVIDLLLKSPDIDIDLPNTKEGSTPLMIAIEISNVDAIEKLIKKGPSLNMSNLRNETALMIATELKTNAAVSLLLAHSASLDYQNDLSGDTAMMIAIKVGNHEALKLLINAGAMIDVINRKGLNAFDIATIRDDEKALEALEESDACSLVNCDDTVIIHHALSYGSKELALELINKLGGQNEKLEQFLRTNNRKAAALLKEGKEALEAITDDQGDSLLIIAVRRGFAAAVALLLKIGVDTEYKNQDGLSALDIALSASNREVIDLLLIHTCQEKNQGANSPRIQSMIQDQYCQAIFKRIESDKPNLNLDVVGQNGQTLLTSAVILEDLKLMELLLKQGANPNLHNASGKSPLDMAIERDNSEMIELLFGDNREINVNMELLINAFNECRKKAASIVLKRVVNNGGNASLLSVAAINGNLDLASTLIGYGFSLSLLYQGKSALCHAAMHGHTSVVNLLLSCSYYCDSQHNEQAIIHINNSVISAASVGALDCVNLLLRQETANINYMNEDGLTPLLAALHARQLQTACKLMIKKAGINAKVTKDGEQYTKRILATILSLAAHRNDPEINTEDLLKLCKKIRAHELQFETSIEDDPNFPGQAVMRALFEKVEEIIADLKSSSR